MAPVTRGWQCPSATTPIPAVKSRYSRPSESQTRTPSPRTRQMGAREYVGTWYRSDHSRSVLVSTVSPSENDLGSDPFLSENLEQDGVGDAAVDDVAFGGPALQRLERRLNLGEHPPLDHAGPDQALGVLPRQCREQPPVLALDSVHVGQVDELFGDEGRGQLPGHQVRIDVVGLSGRSDPYRGDHRNEPVLLQELDGLRIDLFHLANQADVHRLTLGRPVGQPARADQVRVLAGEADGPPAVEVDQAHDLLVDLADEDHLDDVHGLRVGDPHAPDKARFLAEALHQRPDLRPAAVHDHGVDPHVAEQDDVEGEGFLQVRLLHGRAAVLDDEGLALEGADVREGLHQDLGPLYSFTVGAGHYSPRGQSPRTP